jgi:hypothetical protein
MISYREDNEVKSLDIDPLRSGTDFYYLLLSSLLGTIRTDFLIASGM